MVNNMNFDGIVVGAATFFIIGICHPIVIKAEYYIGKRSWWLFLIVGIFFLVLSLIMKDSVYSTIMGATSFSFFWGIQEVIAQEKRVLRGWFPMNPKRKKYYEKIRNKQTEKQNH